MSDIYLYDRYWQGQVVEWAAEWLPRILGAVAILVGTWLLARAMRWAVVRTIRRVPALHNQHEGDGQGLDALLGDTAFWLVFLVGIVAVLEPLGLGQVLEPVHALTVTAFAAVPLLIKAAVIFMVGLVIARIARRLVETALLAIDADRLLGKAGIAQDNEPVAAASRPHEPTSNALSVPRSAGTLVFFLIMIPIAIAALEAAGIAAISEPATQMLAAIFKAIPNVLGAAMLLGIGYWIGRLAKQSIEQILPPLGFDRSMAALGFASGTIAPSRAVATGVMFSILLFFAIKGAELLHSPIIALMLSQLLTLGTRILFGTGIVLAGVAIARIATRLAREAGATAWHSAVLTWTIIPLSAAMGLRFMGLANEIVIIAFAAILGSAAIAFALAFGLGGRAAAGMLLEDWVSSRRGGSSPAQSGRAGSASGE